MPATEAKQTQAETADAAFERRLAAVSEAVDDHHTYLLDYLYRMTHQWQDAENLLQDLWKHVLLNFEEDKINCMPLLRRKAYQLFVDHYRRQVRRGEILSDNLPDVPVQPASYADATDAGEALLKARFWSEYPTLDLTEHQKDVLWLNARYGYTYKEIEEKTGIAASTVGDWIALARKKLADIINNESHT